MHPVLRKLEGGDLRSIGRSVEVVSDILEKPELFKILDEGLTLDNSIIRMRAADALEKASLKHPEHLIPYKRQLLKIAENSAQKEVRWHMAQMLPRLNLTKKEKTRVINILLGYLSGNSSIVSTFVMQALADIAKSDDKLRPSLLVHINELTIIGTPAIKARGRKLLAQFEDNHTPQIPKQQIREMSR